MNVNVKDPKSKFDEFLRNCRGMTTNDYLLLHSEERLNINRVRKGNLLKNPETATYDELLKLERITGHHRYILYTDYKVGLTNIAPSIVSEMINDYHQKQPSTSN